MVYYEINKQTGRTLNTGRYGRLLGYTFKNKDYVYAINLGSGCGLSIIKKLGKGKYDDESTENVDEPFIEYHNITRKQNAKQSY